MIKKRSDFISNNETDPMASLVNMVDIMLVLAVGFLILAISATGMSDIIQTSTNNNQQEIIDVSQGEEIPNDIEESSSSGSGYSRVGSVYQDPETGKLIMIDN